MATLEQATEQATDNARTRAEIAIEKILLDLEHATMRRVDHVNVDTRNFANCDVEIFFSERR